MLSFPTTLISVGCHPPGEKPCPYSIHSSDSLQSDGSFSQTVCTCTHVRDCVHMCIRAQAHVCTCVHACTHTHVHPQSLPHWGGCGGRAPTNSCPRVSSTSLPCRGVLERGLKLQPRHHQPKPPSAKPVTGPESSIQRKENLFIIGPPRAGTFCNSLHQKEC